MRNRLLSTIATALILCAEAALAADLSSPDRQATPTLSPPPLWTGFYLGLNVGYSFDTRPNVYAGFPIQTGLDNFSGGTHAFASALSVTGTSNTDASGALGGGQLGYLHQFGNFAFGVEADIQGLGARGRGGSLGGAGATTLGFPTDNAFSAVETRKAVEWLGTARGRVGYLITPTLLGYATGGLAYGGVDARTLISQSWNGTIGPLLQSSGAAGNFSGALVGWTVGGGAEWAFAPNLSLKAEYLYYDLGDAHLARAPLTTSLFGGLSDTVVVSSRMRFDGHVARLGLNYRLNPLGASPAPQAVAPPPLWTGLYAGLNAGYGWDGGSSIFTSALPAQTDIDGLLAGSYTGLSHSAATALASTGTSVAAANGFVAGGQLGYNYRFGRFVAGVEADIQGAGLEGRGGVAGSASARVVGGADTVLSSSDSDKAIDWLGTARGRVGYLVTPDLLGYATGGFAYGGATMHTATFTTWGGNVLGPLLQSSNSVGNFSDTRIGWTVGGGAEWAFAPNLSVKAEYLFYDLGEARLASSPLATDLFGVFFNSMLPISQTRFQGHVVRAGVNYHFNLLDSSIPLIAKY